MLVQFALTVFAMCALLALIVDLGYARLSQVQMQNAADTAALEGLRRDPSAGQPGRGAARDLAARVFDDDLDPTNGDPDRQFGAGPIVNLTEGVGELHGLQTLSVPDTHVYKPDLQLNQENLPHGDMVRGTFVYSGDTVPSEDAAYSRNDFTPSDTGSAFLVRMRRSNELQDLPGQTEPDVASSGPSIPLTFGKATMIRGDDPSSAYSVRRDGLTVRATAIAEARPALRVGLAQTNPPLPGAARLALLDTCVQNPTGAAVTVNVTINPVTGVVTRNGAGPATCPAGATVGRFVANPAAVSTVGATLPAAVAIPCLTAISFAGSFGPVYSVIGAGTNRTANRVIGFARTNFTRNACPAAPAPPTTPFTATIVRTASIVAASNATANLMNGLTLPATAQPADLTELLDKNRVGPGRVNYGPVLVPVLAR